jgi:hypothetical protein
VAKSTRTEKTERQAKVDKMLAQQKSAERSRGYRIVGVCVVVALLIVGAAAYGPVKQWWTQRNLPALDKIGAAASVCEDPTTAAAEGNQDHVSPGTPITLTGNPPAFGQHFDTWEPMDRKFYTTRDRPDVGYLIHNLEHGFTILWYDETAADDADMVSDIRSIAQKFQGDDGNLRNKFKAVPWTSEDGDAFPDGQHIALTHWSAGGTGDAATGEQVGVTQYCSAPSGAAVEQFMKDYPYVDSPEPNAV